LEIVKSRLEAGGVNAVVIATTTGSTAVKAVEALRGVDLVVVTHSTGFVEPNIQELTAENRMAIERAGAKIVTSLHAFGGVGRAVRRRLGTYELEEIVAFVLRTLGQGFKVCVEISMMAADAGAIRAGVPCIAVGGTGRGADTAVVLSPAHTQSFLDLRVHEILCKPYM
jgi:hypothetical protein